MFGGGQVSGGSPFGTPSIFGQRNNNNNHPFAPNPFGTTTTTPTNPFGVSSSTPANPFGFATTTPMSPFGATPQTGGGGFGGGGGFFSSSSTGVFGNDSSSNTGFQQKSAFGGGVFGANSTTQTNSPFGTPATPLFGASTPAIVNPPASSFNFGQNTSSPPPFGAQNTSSPPFGGYGGGGGGTFSTSTPFGGGGGGATTTTPMFGQSTTPSPSNPFNPTPFGSSTATIFGQSTARTTSPFAAAQSSPFGAPVSNPATQSVFSGNQQGEKKGSRVVGYTSTRLLEGEAETTAVNYHSISVMNPYNTKNHEELRWEDYQLGDRGGIRSPFGQRTATTTFGQQQQSSPNPFSASTASNPFALKSTSPSSPPFGVFSSAPTSTSGFGPFLGQATTQTPAFSTGLATNTQSSTLFQPAASSPFNLSPFTAATAATTSLFPAGPSFATNTPASSPLFQSTGAAASPFGQTSSSFSFNVGSQGSKSLFSTSSLGSNQPASLFQSTTTPLGQTTPFGQNTSIPGQITSSFAFNTTFGQTTNSLAAAPFGQETGQTTTPSNPFGQTTTPSNPFGQTTSSSNPFGRTTTPSNPFGQLASATSTPLFQSNPMGFVQPTPTVSVPFQSQTNQPGFVQPTPTVSTTLQSFQLQPSKPAQNFGTIGSGTFGQTTFDNTGGLFGQNTFVQPLATQSLAVAQPVPTNPFGTLPALPEVSIGSGASPSLKYGIASLPVVDKPSPVRVSSFLTSRHLSHGRTRLPVRKYIPQVDGPKVPFFYDGEEETPTTLKADVLFIPRENPRALVICPVVQQKQQHWSLGKTMPSKHTASGAIPESDKTPESVSATPLNGFNSEDKEKDFVDKGSGKQVHPAKQNQKPNWVADSLGTPKGVPKIQALLPKLCNPDYYTEPMIQELEAKERVEKGYCKLVKDFVVGRQGYGSIMFIGETDVRGLDLDSLIRFNNREVIVYMDECKKPPVGQGLNKPALVTLLNIKCMDKKTGQQYTEGPRIQKYKEMLKKKTEEQGAAFVSYDPIRGEWKFRVEHFN